MSTLEVSQGAGGDRKAAMKAALTRKAEEVFAQAGTAPAEKLAGPPLWWDVIAVGPFQAPGLNPGRVMEVNEQAFIQTIVWLNPFFPAGPQNACSLITGFAGKIEISYHTSNLETMESVPDLSETVCIPTQTGVCLYQHIWEFTPTKPGCLYMTNICVRICNCKDEAVNQYSGFARWVANLDFDLIFGAPVWQFDHPVRFMVSDKTIKCCG